MQQKSASCYFAYALVAVLVGSVFSAVLPVFQPSFASHQDITVEIDDIIYGEGDSVVISGNVDGANEDDTFEIIIDDPSGGTAENEDNIDFESDDGDFSFVFEVDGSDPEEGIYTVQIIFEDEEAYSYFWVEDGEDDVVLVETEDPSYQAGDEVEITGTVEEPESGVEEVEITVLGPDDPADEVVNGAEEEVDNDEFTHAFDLDNDASHGRYAIIVEYDGSNAGYYIFEVEDEDSGSNAGDQITVQLNKSTYARGEEVQITGSIDEVQTGEDEVNILVEDSDNQEVIEEEVPLDGDDFELEFDLEDDANTGTYTVTVTYDGDDKEVTFTVSTSGSGSGGSTSAITVKLNKASYLAGETMTVTGTVPDISNDEGDLIAVLVYRPDGTFVSGSSAFVEPESDKTFSATVRLVADLDEDEGYSVLVTYEEDEAEKTFAITGEVEGAGEPVTVKTDDDEYSVGSTVEISGTVSPVIDGMKVVVQVYNPENAAYRFDLVEPSSSGSYSYELVVGGKLGISGEYEVVATYNEKQAETTFEIEGGPQSTAYNLRFEGDTFPIEYEITGGEINSMFINTDAKKLVVAINAEEDGRLVLVLPREVIDSAEGGSDTAYVVATTDLQAGAAGTINVDESNTSGETRTIIIDYGAGTDLIEISGTSVVPEFPVTAIVLAVSIVGIIVATAKFSRFGSSLLPRN